MKYKIPIALIYAWLLIGIVILLISFYPIYNYKIVIILLLSIGLLTDIFDGIIARKLNISTQKLRRLDSTIDLLFFTLVVFSSSILCPDFFKSNSTQLIILIGFEVLTYLVSFLKFKKEIATHTIGAKIWTLVLFSTLIQIIAQCQSDILFTICVWLGVLTRIEIIAIILILKNWTNDVPSFYKALQLRNNKEIKRNKIFNG